MRYIDKSINRFTEFENFILENSVQGKCLEKDSNGFNTWEQLYDGDCGKDGSNIKTKLHNHLVKEQSYLCIYCERRIKDGEYLRGHIEHILPKSKFQSLVFEYSNLSVSCNGLDCDAKSSEEYITIVRNIEKINIGKNKKDKEKLKDGISCGHRKDDEYDENHFLNPFKEKNIEIFFVYKEERENDKESKGILILASKNPAYENKSRYMIEEVLDLNHDRLKKLRLAVYNDFLRKTNNGSDEEKIRFLLKENVEELYEFHSMLKYFFRYLFG